MEIKRGTVVLVRSKGDFSSKPRPGVIVQSDLFNPTHQSVTVCPVTSHLVAAPLFRVALSPTKINGLMKASQAMVDKVFSIRRENIGSVIGTLDREAMLDGAASRRNTKQLH